VNARLVSDAQAADRRETPSLAELGALRDPTAREAVPLHAAAPLLRPARLLHLTEQLLAIEVVDLEAVLHQAAQLVAADLQGAKVDVWLYDPAIRRWSSAPPVIRCSASTSTR